MNSTNSTATNSSTRAWSQFRESLESTVKTVNPFEGTVKEGVTSNAPVSFFGRAMKVDLGAKGNFCFRKSYNSLKYAPGHEQAREENSWKRLVSNYQDKASKFLFSAVSKLNDGSFYSLFYSPFIGLDSIYSGHLDEHMEWKDLPL